MKITFLGTGTSQGVPMIACNCLVCSSSDPRDKRLRSSILVQDKGLQLVVDTTPDFRYQMLRARVKHLDAILITHSHKDHIAGMDDVRAFNYFQGVPVDIYASLSSQEAIKREFGYAFGKTRYPGVPEINLHSISNLPFEVNGIKIQPIAVMHHQMPVLGFRMGPFTYITDANFVSEESKELIRGSEVLVLNALRKDAHLSHFNLHQAISLAQELKIPQTFLTHISHQLGLHEEVSGELPPGIHLAFDTLQISLAEN
ncbi:MAG: MBL fold metallo-hydrolase [Chitinophagaceae bacterium]